MFDWLTATTATFIMPFWLLGVLTLTLFSFWVLMIVRVSQLERGEDKPTWMIVVVILTFFGAGLYVLSHGKRHKQVQSDLVGLLLFFVVTFFGGTALLFTPNTIVPYLNNVALSLTPRPTPNDIQIQLHFEGLTQTAWWRDYRATATEAQKFISRDTRLPPTMTPTIAYTQTASQVVTPSRTPTRTPIPTQTKKP